MNFILLIWLGIGYASYSADIWSGKPTAIILNVVFHSLLWVSIWDVHSTGWRPSTPCLPCFFTFLILVSPWTAFWTISLELVSNSAFLSSAEYSLLFWRCSSVTQSCRTLRPHGLQPTRLLWPSLFLGHCSNSCPLSRWCHPIISSSVDSSSFPQSFPAPGSFPLSQLLVSGG